MKIIVCDDSVMAKLPNIMNRIYNQFGFDPVIIYSYIDDRNNIGFVARRDNDCLLIDGDRTVGFVLTDEDDLEKVIINNRVYSFSGDKVYMADPEGKKEFSLLLEPLEKEDENTSEAMVTYVQYSYDNDIMCELKFRHVYRSYNGFSPIYDYHLREIDSFYIDGDYTRKGGNHGVGLLPPRSKYYGKFDIYSDTLQYEFLSIKEFGLLNTLLDGSYNLVRDDVASRYVKCLYVDFNGDYRDLFPFAKTLKKEEAYSLIRSYGFDTFVPEEMVRIYNHTDRNVQDVMEIAQKIKQMTPDEKSEKRVMLQLQQ